MADIERWITINGVHVPIMKGESKMAAVGRFIKGKRAQHKKNLKDRAKEYGERIQSKISSGVDEGEAEFQAGKEMRNKYGQYWRKKNTLTITGRTKTEEEWKKSRDRFNPGDDMYKVYDKKLNATNKNYKLSNKYDYKENTAKKEEPIKKTKSTTPRVTKPKGVKSGGRINYDDDLVRVVDSKGKVVYQGIEDYNPMRDERYEFVPTTKDNKGYYKVGNYYVYKVD